MGKLKLFISNIFKTCIDLIATLAFLALSSILVGFSYFLLSLIPHTNWLSAYSYIFTGTFIVWGYLLGHYYSTTRALILSFLISTFCWIATSGSMFYIPAILFYPLSSIGLFLRRKTPLSITSKLQQSSLLVVIAVISIPCLITFTVLMSKMVSEHPDNYSQNLAIAKEAAAIINRAHYLYNANQQSNARTGSKDLIPFMHFIRINTNSAQTNSTKIEGTPLQPCSQRLQCLKLHNGGILQFDTQQTFGGTASTNAIFFNLDPDGYGPEGRVSLYQYFDGEITTGETKRPNTQTSATTLTSQDKDPKYAPKRE